MMAKARQFRFLSPAAAGVVAMSLVCAAVATNWSFGWQWNAVRNGDLYAISAVALLLLGAAGGSLFWKSPRLGGAMLLAFYAIQAPIWHLEGSNFSAFVGLALMVTVHGWDVTVGVGLGGEIVASSFMTPVWPAGAGLNLVAAAGVVAHSWWLLRATEPDLLG